MKPRPSKAEALATLARELRAFAPPRVVEVPPAPELEYWELDILRHVRRLGREEAEDRMYLVNGHEEVGEEGRMILGIVQSLGLTVEEAAARLARARP